MSRSCLIVDDSKIVRKVARKILESQGFTVSESENGAEALEACKASLPDMVLLDWNMPVMDGFACLQQIRATYGPDKPIVIFCTTQNDMSFIMKAMEAGAQEYVMKPFDEDIIQSKLMQVGLL